jgi:hypothetical protein
VRAIFALLREHGSLPPVVRELEARGWANKRWRTRSGREGGGERFTFVGLRRLLTNVLYAGKVRYKDEVHDGKHPEIVDPASSGGRRNCSTPAAAAAERRPAVGWERCCAACCSAPRAAGP